jgi:hypothetical protein
MISAFFASIATWFGFVGSCVGSPSGACVPFLAFVALGTAASAALFIVLLAYRSMGSRREQRDVRDERTSNTLPQREPTGTLVGDPPAAAV